MSLHFEVIVNDALKELRAGATAILTIAAVWLMTAEAVRGSLARRDQARHVAAWLLIREQFSHNDPSLVEVITDTATTRVACIPRTVPIQSGTEIEVCDPFVVPNPWRGDDRDTLVLDRLHSTLSVRQVRGKHTHLPFENYVVAGIHDAVWIIPARFVQSERDAYNAVLRDSIATPEDWATTRLMLTAEGWTGRTAQELRLSDRAVASFIGTGLTASYSISGIPISPGYYLGAVGILMGLFSFLMIGPLLVLHGFRNPVTQHPWIMLSVTPGPIGLVIALIRMLITVAAISLPVAVFFTQLPLVTRLSTSEMTVWVIGIAGLAANLAILLLSAWELARVRRMQVHAAPKQSAAVDEGPNTALAESNSGAAVPRA